MPFTERAGHRIHYRVYGEQSSPPLLLVMGMGLSSIAWDTLPARLAQRFQVIVFDNRGTGESALPRGPYGMRTLAHDAAAVLDAAAVKRADVFGISMGGMIAQELALLHPQRIRRLALGCTFAAWVTSKKPHPRIFLDLLAVMRSGIRTPDEKLLARLLVGPEFVDRVGSVEQFTRWRTAANQGRARRGFLQLLAVGLHCTGWRLRAITAPTLILTGDHDRLVHLRNSEKLARLIPNARLHVLRGAGHVFPLEREDETVGLLEEHFLGAPQPAGAEQAVAPA